MTGILKELGLTEVLETLFTHLSSIPKAMELNDPEFEQAFQKFLSDPRVKEAFGILRSINLELVEWLDIIPAVAGMSSPFLTDMFQNERTREYLCNILLSSARVLREALAIAVAKR